MIIIVVVVVGGFTVMRVRTFFGAGDGSGFSSAKVDDTKPFDPKVVVYEIYGEPGATADVNYLDLDAQPQRIDGVSLPWTLRLESTAPSVFPNIVAQGDGSTISCRITVDDELKDERTSNGVNAQTFCLVKSA
ncbi:transmembrane proteinm, MmpS5 [Mycolicibacterium fortuitum subsp. acetamidolyticum]|uniref:Transmembrane proteinm, MmpS5 n=1 Tax=Mycolicibacterium fortuitum subsp. acetamidolyticum TaxID=144550 RepID=A0A100WX27_MYCFO|nr:MmpS family transport accessory protein [Mycolicibacterium fortuitum]GAT06017.1 transmembrane proteinm, MmpS5 [Mycolicibacterium fortuitum subsp. acetamidolyticum]